MSDRFPIVTLCGSTKFKDDFFLMEKELQKAGYIVLRPEQFEHADNIQVSNTEIEELCLRHRAKIDISDEIVVIDRDDYIGSHTQAEIEYARNKGIPVSYYSDYGCYIPTNYKRSVQKWIKRPVEVEVIQFQKDNIKDVLDFIDGSDTVVETVGGVVDHLIIETLEGPMNACIGDYIIRGIKGEFYPCKPDIFLQTYSVKRKRIMYNGH